MQTKQQISHKGQHFLQVLKRKYFLRNPRHQVPLHPWHQLLLLSRCHWCLSSGRSAECHCCLRKPYTYLCAGYSDALRIDFRAYDLRISVPGRARAGIAAQASYPENQKEPCYICIEFSEICSARCACCGGSSVVCIPVSPSPCLL